MAYEDWRSNGGRRRPIAYAIRKRVEAGEPCALCHKPIDLTLTYPDPRSVSVDHTLPRSRGGDAYDLANCAPAHLVCNHRKGDGTRKRATPTKTKTTPTKRSRQW